MAYSRSSLMRALPLAWLALVAACQEGATIAVEQSARGVSFSMTGGPGFIPCIASAYVYPAGPEDAKLIWSAERLEAKVCIQRITYSDTPAGFVSGSGGTPLASGKRYQVALLGPGFNENRTFVAQ